MSKREFDLLVFIGRFQPFHNGHQAVIKEALKRADEVVVIVGSCGGPRTTRNPFTFEERFEMIRASNDDAYEDNRLEIYGVNDYPYNDSKWLSEIQSIIDEHIEYSNCDRGLRNSNDPKWVDKIGLIGHSKDNTSYYLKMFPGMDSVAVSDYRGINATNIREDLLTFPNNDYYKRDMPKAAQEVLEDIINKDYWALLKQEYRMVQEYKDSWKYAPYAPTFVTTDAVVIQSGYILLVRRGHAPGIGQWALPGGFLGQDETLLDGCIRELREETRLKVPVPVLKGSIKGQHTFDDPNRSSRGRTITQAFYFELTPMDELPKVKGSDDAIEAKWFKLSEVKSDVMFEDHYGIIDYFVGL